MGQYHLTVNLDKKEYLDPHKLGEGLKLREQIYGRGSTPQALFLLLAVSNGCGGGDLFFDDQKNLQELAEKYIGRWGGDRIAVVGDYADKDDLPDGNLIYDFCRDGTFRDITDNIIPLIENMFDVKISGTGWRNKVNT